MPVDAPQKRATVGEFVQLLVWREKDGMLTITPQDEERFSIRLNRAIEVLRRASSAEPVNDQVRLLLRMLAEWLRNRLDIESAYITVRDGTLCLLLVRSEVLYSEEFENAVAELDIAIASDVDLDLIRLNVIALPRASDEAIASFLDPEFSIKYVHGDSAGPDSVGQQRP